MPGTGAIRWGDISFRTRPRRPIEPPILTRRTRDQQTGGTGVMGTEGHGRGAGGRRRGLDSTASAAGVEGAGGSGGPGRGAGGWRQGQGGPRDRPLRAVRLACGDLAGGPPPTGTHSGPALQGRPHGARNTSGATSINTRRRRLAGRPPPTGTHSGPAQKTHTVPGTPAAPHAAPPERGQKESPTAPGTP